MDFEKINKIIEVFKDSGLAEMSLEAKDLKITMKSHKNEVVNIDYSNFVAANTPKIERVGPKEEIVEVKEEGEWVKAPFIGTFYAAPGVGEKPYVTLGQNVKKGDVICILEAMKVMNEIKAPRDGVVLKINKENGSMAEYEENIILIGD